MTEPGNGTRADEVVRAMSDDGAFRVVIATGSHTAKGVCDAQRASGALALRLAELVLGTVLVRETMSPSMRVQGIVERSDGALRLVADAHPDGGVRGLTQRADPDGPVGVGGASATFLRSLVTGALHQGTVQLARDADMSDALTTYFRDSEQVVSRVSVACRATEDGGMLAAGYVVQLLPELTEEVAEATTKRLADLTRAGSLLNVTGDDPDAILKAVVGETPVTVLARSPLRYQCRCDETRILTSLASLSRDDVEYLLAEGKPLEITCDYCSTEYTVAPERLLGLLRPS